MLQGSSSLSDCPSPPALEGETVWERVRALRIERGQTGEEFGALIGLSKGKVSELERRLIPCSPDVALAIEALSGARIDAGDLNELVARARAGHAADGASGPGGAGAAGVPLAAAPADPGSMTVPCPGSTPGAGHASDEYSDHAAPASTDGGAGS